MSPLYQIKALSLLSLVQLCLWCRSSFSLPQPTHWWREVEIWERKTGFLVAGPWPGSQALQMGAGFCFLICVQAGTEWPV